MNPCKILGFRPRTRWQLVVRAATKRTSATNLYYYYFLYFSSFYCNVGASVHLPLLRALENVQKFLENRQYFGGNWSGVERPQENDDGSFQPRSGGGWLGGGELSRTCIVVFWSNTMWTYKVRRFSHQGRRCQWQKATRVGYQYAEPHKVRNLQGKLSALGDGRRCRIKAG